MDEKELIKEYQDTNSDSAFAVLFEQNKKMIERIAKHYCFDDFSLVDDYVIDGAIGLQKAILKYDLSQDTPLSVYAKKYIEGEIANASNKNRFVGVPKYVQAKYFKYRKVEAELEQELGYKPTYDEIADELGDVTPIEIQDVYEMCQSGGVNTDDRESTFAVDNIDIDNNNLEESASIYEKYEDILRPIEYLVLTLLDKYQNDENHTPYELTKDVLHLTENKIRNIECVALRKIRNYIKKEGMQQ